MSGFGRRVMEPRVLLQLLLPEARALADAEPMSTKGLTGLFEAAAPYYREDNLAGVHVYRMEGGWCADVEFATVPAGISNVFGTPVRSPLGTEAEAMTMAKRLLAMVIGMSREPAPPPKDPVFLYHGYEVPLPQALLTAISGMPVGDKGEFVRKRLADVDAMLSPLSNERMNRMTPKENQTFMVVCAMALSQGVLRWPKLELTDGKPFAEEETDAPVAGNAASSWAK